MIHGPYFVHWWAEMSDQEGAIPKLLQSLEHEIVYSERVPFTETKGLSPTPEEQPYTIILPSPNLILAIMESDKYCSPGSCQTQTCPLACQMAKHLNSVIWICE